VGKKLRNGKGQGTVVRKMVSEMADNCRRGKTEKTRKKEETQKQESRQRSETLTKDPDINAKRQ